MTSILPHPKLRHTALFGLLTALLASCGSYQQASYYDTDGIYTTDAPRAEQPMPREARPQRAPARNADGQFYSDYFAQRAEELDQVLESEVFTDIDSYSSTMETDGLAMAQDSLIGNPSDYFDPYANDYAGNPGWGDRGSNVSINFYGNTWGGWYAPGWGAWGYDPWVWNNGWVDPFYYGYGWGWNRWYRPWRNGLWGWNYGWGWNNWNYGWGWNNWNYGWGWNNWAYGSPYYGYNRSWGYNASRRGYYNRNNSNLQGSRYAARTNTTSRYRTNSGRSNAGAASSRYADSRYSRSRINTDAAARARAYRSSRSSRTTPSYSGRTARTYTGNTRGYSQNPYVNRNPGARTGTSRSYSAPRNGANRSYSGATRGSGTYRSSGSSSSRSSGTFRSSGSSGRSSGTFRSSGGGSRSSGSFRSSGGGGGRSSGGGGRSSGGGGRSSGGRSNG